MAAWVGLASIALSGCSSEAPTVSDAFRLALADRPPAAGRDGVPAGAAPGVSLPWVASAPASGGVRTGLLAPPPLPRSERGSGVVANGGARPSTVRRGRAASRARGTQRTAREGTIDAGNRMLPVAPPRGGIPAESSPFASVPN